MLLSSHRHKPKDLDHWASLQRLDLVCGQRLMRSRKPQAAIDAIRRFSAEPCYLATSWGKDSVVTCHLAVLSGAQMPFVHVVQEGPQKDPDQHRVRDAFLAMFDVDYHEIVVPYEPRHHKDDGRAHFPALDIGIREARRRFGHRYIGGLRAAESGVRKRAMGHTFKPGARSCWPIGRWSDQEVYSWLAVHDLPIHPAYACTDGGLWDRGRIRVGIIGGPKGTQFGRAEWEWEYYPDIMLELQKLGIVGWR